MAQDFHYELIVVGGGHAGVEAAFVGSRRGHSTALLTMRWDNIGVMSCNPAIGGSAKGQVVREIDALGGEMGKAIDATGIQFRMLNMSKGPAVWAPRAQADRKLYAADMQQRVRQQANLTVHEEIVEDLTIENGRVIGLVTSSGNFFHAKVVVLATGTFLQGLMHTGREKTIGGRIGEQAATRLSQTLTGLGFHLSRLKTGTPPRIDKKSIDFSLMEEQKGDIPAPCFSFTTREINRPQVFCYASYTTAETHRILLDNLSESPMYSGQIKGIGPRYCPSVEDKVVRFKERSKHQIILEPEGLDTDVMYVNGFSTSMPKDIQEQALRTVPGYEAVKILRFGYAVEYDFIPPIQLTSWLETKAVQGLFLAGQINGTSGYEEAAGQGLMAGINAVQRIRGEAFFVLQRADAYIGVMIDDLVTKSVDDPYRLLTSRAEHRLQLRQDNADLRLTDYGRQYALIDGARYEQFQEKRAKIADLKSKLKMISVSPAQINPILRANGSAEVSEKVTLENILKRPEINFPHLCDVAGLEGFDMAVGFQVGLNLKYDGYIARQNRDINRYQQLEDSLIPSDFDYSLVKSLSTEGRTKLEKVRPHSVGQAGRISGLTPADISLLLIALSNHRFYRHGNVSRETLCENL